MTFLKSEANAASISYKQILNMNMQNLVKKTQTNKQKTPQSLISCITHQDEHFEALTMFSFCFFVKKFN